MSRDIQRREHEHAHIRKLLVIKEYKRIMNDPLTKDLSMTRRYELASMGLMSPDHARRVIRRSEKIEPDVAIEEEIDAIYRKLRLHTQPLHNYSIGFDDGEKTIIRAYKALEAKDIAQTNYKKRVIEIEILE